MAFEILEIETVEISWKAPLLSLWFRFTFILIMLQEIIKQYD